MNVDAILFDLDGTLWDSTQEVCYTWNLAINRHPGLREPITQQEIKSIMGLQMDVIAKKLFPGIPEDQQHSILEECAKEENSYLSMHGAHLFDCIAETLQALKQNYDLCIVSNCQLGYIEAFLNAHKIGHLFHDHICFGETGVRKGVSMRLLMERNNYQTAVYVGDTQGDCDEAHFAGLPFIYAGYGFGKVTSYDYKISGPADLLNIFA